METAELPDLIARCKLGNQQAFQTLYKKTAGKLNGIAIRILRNPDSANEALQEAFVQIWRNIGEYNPSKGEPIVWMSSIVRYRCYDKVRAEKRRIEGAHTLAELDNMDNLADTHSGSSLFCDIGQTLEDCLKGLEEAHRRCILMAYYYGFSREEISSQLQSPVNTVKSWLRRGLSRLQLCLDS